ncbi:MAG TPA: tetratricopeptide repeat protein [Candidatus Eisenbacteria bacterium]|nr:tetratricopeptide repeat protein [Candidatus Eisenbacteria bacterium]
MNRARLFTLVALAVGAHLFTPSHALAAKPSKPATTFEDASKHYLAKEWEASAAAFAEVVKAEPKNGRAWYRLGVSYQNMKMYDKAIPAYRTAESINHSPFAMYNLACAFAASGAPDSSIAWLERAAGAGYSQPDAIASDPDLAAIRGDARYAALVEKMQRAATPCAFAPESRQFDFWVGAWDVRTATGDLAGTNEIKTGAGKCVLIENWKDTQGGSGQSLNFYDFDKKQWNQIWVDANTQVTRFEGNFTDGAMRFTGERVSKTGQKVPVKMTFTPLPDGRVRQMGEMTPDGGKTWTVEYDLYYSPARRDG